MPLPGPLFDPPDYHYSPYGNADRDAMTPAQRIRAQEEILARTAARRGWIHFDTPGHWTGRTLTLAKRHFPSRSAHGPRCHQCRRVFRVGERVQHVDNLAYSRSKGQTPTRIWVCYGPCVDNYLRWKRAWADAHPDDAWFSAPPTIKMGHQDRRRPTATPTGPATRPPSPPG